MPRFIKIIAFAIVIASQWSCSSMKSDTSTAFELNQFRFEDLDSLIEKDPRPILVFLHAEWCQFCRNMEQTTFQNQKVIHKLNKEYYFISFDGEQKEEISFRGWTFRNQPRGRNSGIHELAQGLGTINNGMSYPTIAILNTEYEIVFQHGAFLKADELLEILEL